VIGEFFEFRLWNIEIDDCRWGTYSTTGAANAGLDLEMPGATKWRGEMLTQAVGVNKVPQHVLDERVRNVLNLVNRCAAANIPEHAEEKTADTPETAALLRKIGGESIVLMKNEDNILPLKKGKKVIPATHISYASSTDLLPRP
jgi:beta-glucosidase